ncbi:MAG: DUF1735 and LamG domain-containing protein [Bacteroidales bacterium]|nr:DUF1735 and LamG domain-containing protein [Bacteroidales bacterium]
MKRTIIILTAILALFSCDRYSADGYKFANSAYLDVSSHSSTQTATFGNNIPEFTKELSVLLSYPSETDADFTMSVDEALVGEYNARYGTAYEMLPAKYYEFPSVDLKIEAGRTMSESASVRFKGLMGDGEEQTGAMEIDHTYLLPVKLSSANMELMQAASVAYYLVRRSSAITVAAQLTDNWINFPTLDQPGPQSDAFNGLTGLTYEALIFIDRFDLDNTFGTCNISSVMGVEQYCLLRIGDANFERQQIQFDGSGGGTDFGKFPASDASKKLYEGRWYHVAATYDYDSRTVRVYVDGRIQSEATEMGGATDGINLAQRAQGAAEAYQFFIGKSYNDYRPLQGKIAEARVWSVARTPDQIWENMYRIENPQEDPTLIGYWKFNEGKGNVIKDHSQYGNDGVAETDIIWPSGIEIPEINKEEE